MRAVLASCLLPALATAATLKATAFLDRDPTPVQKQSGQNAGHDIVGDDFVRIQESCMMSVCTVRDSPWSACVAQCRTELGGCLGGSAANGTFRQCEKKVTDHFGSAALFRVSGSGVAGRNLANVRTETFQDIRDRCHDACGSDVDSSCVPECQVKMYMCLDHDPKVPEGAAKYNKCADETIAEYEGFAQRWQQTHPYLLHLGRHLSQADLAAISEDCEGACGDGVDSSCVPECEVQMYACEDHNQHVSEGAAKFNKCTKDVLRKYMNFREDWEDAHPYMLTVIRRHVSARELEGEHQRCVTLCGDGVDSSCVPECQVEMYTCLDNDRKVPDGAAEYDKCAAKVVAKYETFKEDWEAKHPYLLARSLKGITATELRSVASKCNDLCGPNADSSCSTECDVQMYLCRDHDALVPAGAKKYEECVQKVEAKYSKFVEQWNAVHPYFLSIGSKRAGAVALDSLHFECVEVCGADVDSSCVPECQVRMYQCGDHDSKTTEGAKKYEECTSKVLDEYRQFAATWQKTHPYLLIALRHTSAAKIQAAHQECVDACGTGVDSSCVPECQVQMYSCRDHDSKVPEGAAKYNDCVSEVLEKYQQFAEDWNKKHPYR